MARELEFQQVTTRGGDKGESSLFDGQRRRKDDAIFEALGDLDELTSWIGLVRARRRDSWTGALGDADRELREVQSVIQRVCALIACSPGSPEYARLTAIDQGTVGELELREARLLRVTTIRPSFVLPGESEISAELDVARSICRRCERRIVSVIRAPGNPRPDLHTCQHYLNRLSDYLFVAARCAEQGGAE